MHKALKVALGIVLLFPLIGLATVVAAWYAARSAASRQDRIADAEISSLHVSKGRSSVVVPFKVVDGDIIVNAMIGNRPTKCLIDTGADEVAWPAALRLEGMPLPMFQTSEWAGGVTTDNKYVQLGSITIDGFMAKRVRSLSDPHANPDRTGSYDVILGNRLFNNYTLCVDYPRCRLEISSRGVESSRTSKSAMVGRIEDVGASNPREVADVRIDGMPVDAVIDTGSTATCISDDLARRLNLHPVFNRDHSHVCFGVLIKSKTSDKSVTLQLGHRTVTGRLIVMPLPPGVDMVLGYDVLRAYKLTIDYPRKLVLLESAAAS